jgi:hypothetical protein
MVDVRDLLTLATNWQGNGKISSQGDFNYDGKVDVADLTILARNWQKTPDGTVLSATAMPAILPQPTLPPVSARPTARTAFKVVSLIQ